MCEYCRTYPHKKQCPNYESPVVEICDECGTQIFEVDKYYEFEFFGEFIICEDCVKKHEKTAVMNYE